MFKLLEMVVLVVLSTFLHLFVAGAVIYTGIIAVLWLINGPNSR